MATRVALGILLLSISTLANGAKLTKETDLISCDSPFKAQGECHCDGLGVAGEIRKILSWFLMDDIVVRVGALNAVDTSLVEPTFPDIQSAYDWLTTKTFGPGVMAKIMLDDCAPVGSNDIDLGATLRLKGARTAGLIHIEGKPGLPENCRLVFDVANAVGPWTSIALPSAEIMDMKALITLENRAEVMLTGVTLAEKTTNTILTVGIWVDDASRLLTHTPTVARPAGKAEIIVRDCFVGFLGTNQALIRAARENAGGSPWKGGIECQSTSSCVSLERMSLAEIDGATALGTYRGEVKTVGLLSRSLSLLLADYAQVTGAWTAAMAREGSGLQARGLRVVTDQPLVEMQAVAVDSRENSWVSAREAEVRNLESDALKASTNGVVRAESAQLALTGSCASVASSGVVEAGMLTCNDTSSSLSAIQARGNSAGVFQGATINRPAGGCLWASASSIQAEGNLTCIAPMATAILSGWSSAIDVGYAIVDEITDPGMATNCADSVMSSHLRASSLSCTGAFQHGLSVESTSSSHIGSMGLWGNAAQQCLHNAQSSSTEIESTDFMAYCKTFTNYCAVQNATGVSLCA